MGHSINMTRPSVHRARRSRHLTLVSLLMDLGSEHGHPDQRMPFRRCKTSRLSQIAHGTLQVLQDAPVIVT